MIALNDDPAGVLKTPTARDLSLNAVDRGDAGPGSSDDPKWHYLSVSREKQGPISVEALSRLFSSGEINADTLVWTKSMGHEWAPFHTTQLYRSAVDAPPPVPKAGVSDALAWLLAFIPLIGIFVEAQLYAHFVFPAAGIVTAAYFIVNTVLCVWDTLYLDSRGYKGMLIWCWLVPVYLFRRATLVKKWPLQGLVWVACFFVSVAYPRL